MKILVLDEEFPFPVNTGKRTRSFNLYTRLAKQFEISYIGYGHEASKSAEALRNAGIEPISVHSKIPDKQGVAFYLRLFMNLFSSLPYIVTSHYSHAYQMAVDQKLKHFQPDVIICEWTPYTVYVKGNLSARKIVSTHNIEADIWYRYLENETNLLRHWYINKQWEKVETFERAALNWVDGATAVSTLDQARLLQWRPELTTKMISNGVDLNYFRPAGQPNDRHHLVFSGSMDWRPNQDAARYFVREILPLVKQTHPNIECTFVGRSPPPDIQALENVQGVNITGTVDDVRPYIERAAIYIVPLRVGGGSRLKILEALAMGRAVVSTSIGAEGLDVVHGKHLLLADEPIQFAELILRLLKEPASCAELAAQGRDLVDQKYGWAAIADTYAEFMRELSKTKPAQQL